MANGQMGRTRLLAMEWLHRGAEEGVCEIVRQIAQEAQDPRRRGGHEPEKRLWAGASMGYERGGC